MEPGRLSFSASEVFDFVKNHRIIIGGAATAGIGLYALRCYFNGGICRNTDRLDGKTVIITGANVGIGRETAKNLAARGARVILACRDLTKAERAAEDIRNTTGNGNVDVRIVDLASFASIRGFAKNILKSEERIDLLINNAGVMWCPRWTSEDGHEMQLAVNHLGHFLLTNLLLDRIKASAPSRIINLSSIAHADGEIKLDDINSEKSYDPFQAYNQSKLANVLFTRELNKLLKGTGVTVFAVHPGVVKSELGRYIPMNQPKWQRLLWLPIIMFVFKSTVQGAQTTIHCCVSKEVLAHSGEYFSDCEPKEPAPQAQDDDMARKLWTLSERLVGLKDQDD